MSAQQLAGGRSCALAAAPRRRAVRCSAAPPPLPPAGAPAPALLARRAALRAALFAGGASLALAPPAQAYATNRKGDDDFTVTASGLRFLDLRDGAGELPRKGAQLLAGSRRMQAPAGARRRMHAVC
jgi:hypothetical protein